MAERIGIDLGGTKIELVVLAADGSVRWRRRVPTPQGDYAATVHAIVALIHDAEAAIGAAATIGIGTPGSPSAHDGRIRNANSTCLNGQPLQHDLEALLGRPVRLANDANCLAMSEAADGAGQVDTRGDLGEGRRLTVPDHPVADEAEDRSAAGAEVEHGIHLYPFLLPKSPFCSASEIAANFWSIFSFRLFRFSFISSRISIRDF